MQPYLPYLLLLGAVVIVAALVMPRKKQLAELPDQTIQNMENALEQFMENMEQENRELLQLVAEAQRAAKAESELKDKRIDALEQKCGQLSEQLQQLQLQLHASVHQAAPDEAEEKLAPTVPRDTIQSRYPDLFRLYDEGKSIEAISKKLGMNKGEVQLIIQLAKQEAAAHA